MRFKQCRGFSRFKCCHELDERPNKVTIETCVAEREKGDENILVKKLFIKFHNELKKKYQEIFHK